VKANGDNKLENRKSGLQEIGPYSVCFHVLTARIIAPLD
jgi:hypothetical protein